MRTECLELIRVFRAALRLRDEDVIANYYEVKGGLKFVFRHADKKLYAVHVDEVRTEEERNENLTLSPNPDKP